MARFEKASMKIKFQYPRILQQHCDDQQEMKIEGDSVGQVLARVKTLYPELHGCICDETGSLRQHINLFINNDLVPRGAFETSLASGDTLSVFQAVSGG